MNNESTVPKLERYRVRGRIGVQQIDVDRAADALLRQGERPSQEKIREQIGGSPNTLGPLLDDWWRRLGARVATGPSAFERLPGSLALMAESFFLHALDEARRSAGRETRQTADSLQSEQRSVDARTAVLDLREKDWAALLERQREEIERAQEQVSALLAVNARLEASREYYERALARALAAPRAKPAPRARVKTTRKMARSATKAPARKRRARIART